VEARDNARYQKVQEIIRAGEDGDARRFSGTRAGRLNIDNYFFERRP
jgi:hypothetical protein